MQDYSKGHLEYIRYQAKQNFDKVRQTWIECGRWALPHRIRWMLSQQEGRRNNQHIVDATHILSLRSFVAGFMEGNTSSSRPWFRVEHPDPDTNMKPENREWLDLLTRRTLQVLSSSNFYNYAGSFYYDYGVFNTGACYIEEIERGPFFHSLMPGSYSIMNNNLGEADILVREFSLTVKALVDAYGKKDKNGNWDWSNFSDNVYKMYTNGTYDMKIDVVHIILPNKMFDPKKPVALMNKQWLSFTYEIGGLNANFNADAVGLGASGVDPLQTNTFLNVSATKRKPFIVGKSDSSMNFEYGEKGPTLDALGTIKSLNKKAIGKDIALEQMLKPAVQGPASLRKSYISTQSNAYVPVDAQSMVQGGLKPIFQINPAIATLNADVGDLRNQVEKMYFADYLLYLTQNPKTRTATETNAVVQEQQMIIGPNLQSLNFTFNEKVVDFAIDYVLDKDPFLPPPPPDLVGQFLRTIFISVFAQAQRSADLPSIDRFKNMVMEMAPLNPKIWDTINLEKLASLYEDRLYLPAGLKNPKSVVDALQQQAAAQAQRQQLLNETLPSVAGAAKDLGVSQNTNNNKGATK